MFRLPINNCSFKVLLYTPFLEKSKEEWKRRTKELEAELAQMEAKERKREISVYREESYGYKNPPPPSEQEESEKLKKNEGGR
jgi:hypothetical protein